MLLMEYFVEEGVWKRNLIQISMTMLNERKLNIAFFSKIWSIIIAIKLAASVHVYFVRLPSRFWNAQMHRD